MHLTASEAEYEHGGSRYFMSGLPGTNVESESGNVALITADATIPALGTSGDVTIFID